MISWRYHLVSIVAVILALALGVLAGATVIGDRFVSQLQANTESSEHRASQYFAELRRLQGVVSAATPFLVSGRLADERIVIVTQEPVDLSVLAEVRRSVEEAGAQVVAQITATSQIVAKDAQTQLADLLGRQGTDAPRLPALLASDLADRIAIGATEAAGNDLLDRASEFIRVDPAGVKLQEIGGSGTMVVVVAGGTVQPSLGLDAFLIPLVETLAKAPSTPLAAGERLTSDWGFVRTLRDDDGQIPKGSIVTVDDLDETYGGLALVMGLSKLLTTPDGGGDYGVDGDGLLPTPPQSP